MPPFLAPSLWGWVRERVVPYEVDTATLALIELQVELPLGDQGSGARLRNLEGAVKADSEVFLDVVDFLVRNASTEYRADDIARYLSNILGLAGSVWQVSRLDGSYQLTRRIDPAVQATLSKSMSTTDRASLLLSAAVGHAYGRKPNSSIAYREAVRAVEAIGANVVLPKDPAATLGKMIVAMKDKPSKWRVVLTNPTGDPVLAIVGMMELLWKSQLDRHGTDDEGVPLNIGLPEAQAAVHMAATLVQLFRSGAISKT